MSNCNSLSCGRHGPWVDCHCNWGCSTHCGCNNTCGSNSACGCSNTCFCVAGDTTPACNPCAPWGSAASTTCNCNQCNHWNCGSCGCNTCGSTCGDTTASGCLIPRYRRIGRTFQRRITQTLCVNDLPTFAESPLTLVCVTVSGQATWEQISECRQQLLRVTVPVAVQIRDCAGRCFTGHTTVTLTIPLCNCCPAQDFWRGQLYVAPCIRLAACVPENEDGCFDATLEVQADVYLVRIEAVNC